MYKKTLHRLSFFLFLCSLCAALLTGCSDAKKNSPKGVVKRELNLIKNLDEETLRSFSSYGIFSSGDDLSEEMNQSTAEAIKLFFQNFSYKIQSTDVTDDQAVVAVSITNVDAQALANDLCRAIIADSLDHSSQAEDSSFTFYSDLLKNLLTQNTYELKTTSLEIQLEKVDDIWTIVNSSDLEDGLVSGLISYMQSPDTVSAEEVVDLNLAHFQSMTPQEFISYFGIEDIFSTSSTSADQIDLVFAEKILENLQYQIVSSEGDASSASVSTELTHFDLLSVLNSYKTSLLEYAETADAILATEQERIETTAQLLLRALQDSSAVTTSSLEIQLQNTGLIWEIQNTADLTDALLGNITEASKAFAKASKETETHSAESEAETESLSESELESETETLPLIQPAS